MIYCKKIPCLFFLLSLLSVWFFQGCQMLKVEDVAKRQSDKKLPEVIQARTLVDVSSVGFEWNRPDSLDGVEGYAIAIKDPKDPKKGFKTLFVVKNPYATHAYVSGLSPKTPYTFYLFVLGKHKRIATKYKLIHVVTSFISPVEQVFTVGGLPKEIKIFWIPHPNPSVHRYIVQRKEKKGQKSEFLTIAQVPHRLMVEYFDKGLEDGKHYTYRVIAESFEGKQSEVSEVVSAQTREKPLPVKNVKATKNLPKSIEITWDKPINPKFPIESYTIYASNKPDADFKQIAGSKQTSFRETGLGDNQKRYYKVVAVDIDGIVGSLDVAPTLGRTLPPPPTPIITLSQMRKNAAVLKWEVEDASRIVSYKVCRSERGKKRTIICYENIETPFFIDREMRKGVLYFYEVYSVDNFGVESLPAPVVQLVR